MGGCNSRGRRFPGKGTFEKIPEGVTFNLKEVTEGALSIYKGHFTSARVLRWAPGRDSKKRKKERKHPRSSWALMTAPPDHPWSSGRRETKSKSLEEI